MTSYCWRQRADRNPKPCEMSKCCYDASCKAVFEYWKFANSEEWKRMVMVAKELKKERERGDSQG